MQQESLNLDDFPESPYARELRSGPPAGPFAPAVEREYRNTHLESVHLRTRLAYLAWFLVTLITLARRLRQPEVPQLATLIASLLSIPPTFALSLIAWSPAYRRWFVPASRVLAPIAACGLTNNIVWQMGGTDPFAILGLPVDVFAFYFLAGLSFRAALFSNVVLLATFVASGMLYDLPAISHVSATLLIASAIIAIVHRDNETAQRRNFLERALIRNLAARDGLTGLLNRRAFDEHLHRVWQHAMRDGRHIGLLLLDIDHFKAFNDCHGHLAGDSALRHVAQVVDRFARRPLDLAARYGGEEFALIFFDIPARQLLETAEQLRLAVEQLAIGAEDNEGRETPVTVSIGAGIIVPAIGRSIKGAIQFADEALYRAKQCGRNRVVIRGADEYLTSSTGTFIAPKGAAAAG